MCERWGEMWPSSHMLELWQLLKSMQTLSMYRRECEKWEKERLDQDKRWHFIICFPVALAADFLLGVYFIDYDKEGNTKVLFSVVDTFSIRNHLLFFSLCLLPVHSSVWYDVLWLFTDACVLVCMGGQKSQNRGGECM